MTDYDEWLAANDRFLAARGRWIRERLDTPARTCAPATTRASQGSGAAPSAPRSSHGVAPVLAGPTPTAPELKALPPAARTPGIVGGGAG